MTTANAGMMHPDESLPTEELAARAVPGSVSNGSDDGQEQQRWPTTTNGGVDPQAPDTSEAQSQAPAQAAAGNPAPAPRGPEDAAGNNLPPGGSGVPGVPATAPTPKDDPATAYAKKKGGFFRTLAESLAGGPRTHSYFDPNTNTVIHKTQPLSGAQIAMGIALEAITGGLAGASAPSLAQAAPAGMQQARKSQAQLQKKDDDEDLRAQEEFTNKQTALATNLRTHALAMKLGTEDETSHKDWIAGHAATANYFRTQALDGIVRPDMSEEDVSKPAFVNEMLQKGWIGVPISYEARYDDKGQHISQNGTAMHNDRYMVVDGRKMTFPPEVLAKAQGYHLQGTVSSDNKPITTLRDAQVRAATIVDMTNKVARLDAEQRDLDTYYAYLAKNGVKGEDGKPITAPNLKDLTASKPGVISAVTDAWQNHFGFASPNAALKVMKDGSSKGLIASLYGGDDLLNKYDMYKDRDKKDTEAQGRKAANFDTIDQHNYQAVLADPTSFTPEQVATAKNVRQQGIDDAAAKSEASAKASAPYHSQMSAKEQQAEAEDIADAIANHRQAPEVSKLYRQAAPVKAILERKYHMDVMSAERDWKAVNKRLQTMNGDRQVRMQQAVTTSYNTLPTLERLYNEWKVATKGVSGFKLYNRFELEKAKQMGGDVGKAANNLDRQIADMTAELSVVYMGGNTPTDHGLELAAKNFKGEWDEKSFRDAIKLTRENINIRYNSILTSDVAMGVAPDSPYQVPPGTNPSLDGMSSHQPGPSQRPQKPKFVQTTRDGKFGKTQDGQWVPIIAPTK